MYFLVLHSLLQKRSPPTYVCIICNILCCDYRKSVQRYVSFISQSLVIQLFVTLSQFVSIQLSLLSEQQHHITLPSTTTQQRATRGFSSVLSSSRFTVEVTHRQIYTRRIYWRKCCVHGGSHPFTQPPQQFNSVNRSPKTSTSVNSLKKTRILSCALVIHNCTLYVLISSIKYICNIITA